ncbi:hypothetical protein LPTSP3_g24570 [Leptospira kobayashii]|uniref:VOC domain-containing protein n=1 Tax=Leptospira kobayashii TaxID=1917830 RepID=A0ABM7UKU6_9LEPT|nr:VOC family protein [Leptospira kobayashii]BDA79527.1 hypothetical protein LPTSP3_g24570 [Leptospira kobayashii]
MKKFSIIIIILVAIVSVWWGITASQSDYHAIENSDFSYATVIINSPDPERLSDFYRNVFGAEKIKSGYEWNLVGSEKDFISLKTPGYREGGPLITIGKIDKSDAKPPLANDLGYAHICFESDNIPGLIKQILKNGGKILSTFEDLEKVPAAYATDPDGNVFEIHLPFPTPLTPKTIYRSLNSLIRTNFKLSPPETDMIRFLHVNINSADWSKTVVFYTKILSTSATGFERDYKGDFIERLTGVSGAKVRGRHVTLPGYSEGGPTFEVFTYNQFSSKGPLNKSEKGRVATGFLVRDLNAAVNKVVQEGGILISQNGNQTALLKDIDGNLLVFAEKK